MMDEYRKGLHWFCDRQDVEADSKYHWFPRACCQEHVQRDKRGLGLFKVEFQGSEIIGLCSKTYIVKNEKETKFSSKGISKRLVQDPLSIFHNVLSTQHPSIGLNKGFRARDNTIFSYTQQRAGFTYFYCKRRVLDDGVSTVPLDLELSPWPNPEEEDEEDFS